MRKSWKAQKKLTFKTIEDALNELNAQDKGRYFLCTCPECQRNEAFIYKNNLNFIQCNRENFCGERMILQFKEKVSEASYKKQKIHEEYPELTEKQVEALNWTNKVFKHVQKYFESEALDNGYRGISKDIAKEFIVDFKNEKFVAFLFSKMEPLLGKDYSKNEWMCKRNLVFPVYGQDNNVDRILLRSSIEPNIEPKEIQLIVNPSKETRDFFISLPNQSKTLVITEAVLDGLSFREIDPSVGFIALTGSAKTRNIKDFISRKKRLFQDKDIVLAMDDDVAGWRANAEIMTALEENDIFHYQIFLYPNGITDSNELLNENRVGFKEKFHQVKQSFNQNSRDLIDVEHDAETVVICNSRLDAVSFKAIDSNVGVVALENNRGNRCAEITEFILENEQLLRGKQIVGAFPDNLDREFKNVTNVIKALDLEYRQFDYPNQAEPPYVKNLYDFLRRNDREFKRKFLETLSAFEKRDKKMARGKEFFR